MWGKDDGVVLLSMDTGYSETGGTQVAFQFFFEQREGGPKPPTGSAFDAEHGVELAHAVVSERDDALVVDIPRKDAGAGVLEVGSRDLRAEGVAHPVGHVDARLGAEGHEAGRGRPVHLGEGHLADGGTEVVDERGTVGDDGEHGRILAWDGSECQWVE